MRRLDYLDTSHLLAVYRDTEASPQHRTSENQGWCAQATCCWCPADQNSQQNSSGTAESGSKEIFTMVCHRQC